MENVQGHRGPLAAGTPALTTGPRPRAPWSQRAAVLVALAVTVALLPVPAAAEETFGFEAFPDGTPIPDQEVILNEFAESHGLRFPGQVRVHVCDEGRPCPAAAAGQRVATGLAQHEFQLDPVEVTFDTLQETVSVAVDGFHTGGTIEAELVAYDAGGAAVGSDSASFARGTWPRLTVGGGGDDRIARIVVTGGPESSPTSNFIAVDELRYSSVGDEPAGGGDDTAPQFVELRPADGFRATAPFIDAFVEVADDVRLSTVDVRLTAPDGSVSGGSLCGSSTSCGTTRYSAEFQLELTQAGEHSWTVEACDAADNCAATTRRLVYDPPTEPLDARMIAVEVNQGVMGRPLLLSPDVDGPVAYPNTIPVVPGKAIVVRTYWGVPGGAAREVAPPLRVEISYADGRPERVAELTSNVDPASATAPTVAVDGSDWREVVEGQRPVMSDTVNYVLPPWWTRGAEEVRLGDHVVVAVGAPARLGFNLIRPIGEGLGLQVTDDDVRTDVLPYLRAAAPVDHTIPIHTSRTFVWSGEYAIPFVDECASLLFDVWWAYGGYDAPYRPPSSDGVWIPTAAFVSTIADCNGLAYFGDPDDEDDRVGETFISRLLGDTALHEIGHTMGLDHATEQHEESGGEPWPYPHGAMSPDGHTTFGVTAELVAAHDHRNPAGRWRVRLVDPCPGTSTSDRAVVAPLCGRTTDSFRHELMSYGSGGGTVAGLTMSSRTRWPSDITYRRMHSAIAERRISPPAFSQEEPTRVEGVMVTGVQHDDGTVVLAPLLTKPVAASTLTPSGASAPAADEVAIDLRAADGTVLETVLVEPHATDSTTGRIFQAIMPAHAEAASLVVHDGSTTLAELHATPAAPQVSIVSTSTTGSPAGGEVTLRWTVDDDDGDDWHALVSVSTDGGATWSGAAVIRGDGAPEATLDLSDLPVGADVVLRVLATDGFTTAGDEITLRGGVHRVPGDGVRGTAVATCQALRPIAGIADHVVLARDDVFADALAGAPLAGADTCILFTAGGADAELDPSVRDEIVRVLGPDGTVRVLGGANAVSTAVTDELEGLGYEIERFAGATRFETAVEIARAVNAATPRQEAILAFGDNWPDAVTAGAWGAATGTPILLTQTATLHTATGAALDELGVTRTHVIGGTAAISDAAAAHAPSPQRVAGSNRMATAVAVAEELWRQEPTTDVTVVNLEHPQGWAVALAAAPLAAARTAPQLGVAVDRYPDETSQHLTSAPADDTATALIIGGHDFVSEAVLADVRGDLQ